SASPGPMSWISRSENRGTGCWLSAVTVVFDVVNEGVWHSAQPVLVNSSLPFAIEAAPPGVSVEGTGASRKRMKNENLSIALTPSGTVAASVLVTSFGIVANWQAGFSSRSVWNSSLVMPISTLYASPENRIIDLFWAFHPNLAMVPSLPLLLVWPEIVRPLTW